MASISRIKPEQVLYTVTRQKMGNTTMTRKAIHQVKVLAVDHHRQRVLARWNYNPERWFYKGSFKSWKTSVKT